MIVISAMSPDHVIGSGDGMPWDVPEEYAQFLRFIEGQTVIIGRRSYEIFGSGLTSAHTLVVSRSARKLYRSHDCRLRRGRTSNGRNIQQDGVQRRRSVDLRADRSARRDDVLSYIKGTFSRATRIFRHSAKRDWTVERREDHPRFEFVVYQRKRA